MNYAGFNRSIMPLNSSLKVTLSCVHLTFLFASYLSYFFFFFLTDKTPGLFNNLCNHYSKKKYPYILSVNLSYRSYRTRIKDRSVDCLFMHSFATYFDMFALGHARHPRQTISNRSTIHRSWIAIASMFSKRYQYSKQLVVFPDQETCSALDIRSLERDIELGSP